MRALVYDKYGSPDVLKLEKLDSLPEPDKTEVLIKVKAASVNPYDWHFLRGTPFVIRFQAGLFKPKYRVLGYDVAGEVEEIGSEITRFQKGDKVYGASINGGFADYAYVKEDNLISKPDNISFEEAASLPMVVYTAYQGLVDNSGMEPGLKILINGASGGVGTMAVQIAKIYNTEVTAVCSSRNLELVKSLGADHVIDYTKEDFATNDIKYDTIFDTVGNRTYKDLRNSLNTDGNCVVIGFQSFNLMFQSMLMTPFINDKIVELMVAKERLSDLEFANEHLIAGRIKAVIDKTYPLEKLPEAIAYVEKGHARGKVVITM